MKKELVKGLNKMVLCRVLQMLKLIFRKPMLCVFASKVFINQYKAYNKRKNWLLEDVNVPPVMIVSITQKCNLQCKGCYSKVLHTSNANELNEVKFRQLLVEADQLGISTVFIAGGEPFIKKSLIETTYNFPNILFPVFTNGLLIDENAIAELNEHKNVIPIISLEGDKLQTDERRGNGIFDKTDYLMQKLNEKNTLWGVSITLTSQNFSTVVNDNYIKDVIAKGCSFVFFIEYVPVDEQSEYLVLTSLQRENLISKIKLFKKNINAVFFAFPGDEEKTGGCLAAGRGFIHINAQGSVEPCPFAPFSDMQISNVSLKDAIQSKMMTTIRENHHLLTETKGGCSLWANKELIKEMIKAETSN
jgi:MoaA/NifB/PqqE/SkfB family radical SAM enzyme